MCLSCDDSLPAAAFKSAAHTHDELTIQPACISTVNPPLHQPQQPTIRGNSRPSHLKRKLPKLQFQECQLPHLQDNQAVPYGVWLCSADGCANTYPTRGQRNKHFKTHEKPIACPYCPHKAATQRDMGRHVEAHGKRGSEGIWWCRLCESDKSFTRADNRDKHYKKYHAGASSPLFDDGNWECCP